ncbi:hypothetical protein N9J26_01385 [bacterium]|nr:hypothetical protein [bacterium]
MATVALNPLGSARTSGYITFDFSSGVTNQYGQSGLTYHTLRPSKQEVGTTRITVKNINLSKNSLTFFASTAGSNPLMKGAPDIDTFVRIKIELVNKALKVDGEVFGDDFPSTAIFIKNNISREHVCIFHNTTTAGKNIGPFTRLFGSHESQSLGTIGQDVFFT